MVLSVSSYKMKRTSLSLQKSCKQRWRTSAVHLSHTQTGAPVAPRRVLLTADGFQNRTSMLKHLEKIVLITQGKDSDRRPGQGSYLAFFLQRSNGVGLCLPGCPAAVDLGCIHFPLRTTSETIIPLRRQSHKSFRFSVNSCSISTSKPSIESSRPQVLYSKTRSEQGQHWRNYCDLKLRGTWKDWKPHPRHMTGPLHLVYGPDRRGTFRAVHATGCNKELSFYFSCVKGVHISFHKKCLLSVLSLLKASIWGSNSTFWPKKVGRIWALIWVFASSLSLWRCSGL